MAAYSVEELKRVITSQSFTKSNAYNRYLDVFLLGCKKAGYRPDPTKVQFLIYGYYGTTADLNESYGGYEFHFTPMGF